MPVLRETSRWRRWAGRGSWLAKRGAAAVAIGLLLFLALRVWESQRGLPLEIWHTHIPTELTVNDIADAFQHAAQEPFRQSFFLKVFRFFVRRILHNFSARSRCHKSYLFARRSRKRALDAGRGEVNRIILELAAILAEIGY